MKILFAGGGTGGHVYPNFAVMSEIEGNDNNYFYIGEKNSLEQRLCEENGVKFYDVKTPKLIRGRVIENLSIPVRFYRALKACVGILDEVKPNVVFCKGGYVSLPVAAAAKAVKIPVVIHESDRTLGLANKLSYPFCEKCLLSFPKKKYKDKELLVGNPIRRSLFSAKKIELFSDGKPTILFIGGSSGAKEINDVAKAFYAEHRECFNVLLISGKGGTNQGVDGYLEITYSDDIGSLIKSADFVISRGGANALAEITALKKPSLIFPLSGKGTRGDQVLNAKEYESDRLIFLHDKSIRKISDISAEIIDFYSNKSLLEGNLASYTPLPSAKLIADILVDIALKKA